MALSEDLYVEKQYLDGYVPSSWDAPHSSLQRSATWVGMGCILASLAGFGMAIFGLATHLHETQVHGINYLYGGLILALALLFGGFFLIHVGRKNYHAYQKRTGRLH